MNQTPPAQPPRPPENPPVVHETGSLLPFFLALAVLLVIAYGGYKWWQVDQWQQSRGEAMPATAIGPPLTEFELTESSGEPFRSTDMLGKVWVVTYFFTTCPGNCIRLNQNIQLLHNLPELEDVTWVSISCDPDNDTVEALDDYAKRWEADRSRWLFCRGEMEYVQRVARGMDMTLFRKGHQDYAIVIDKAGKIRGVYNATSKADCQRLRKRLLECLAESPPHDLATTRTKGATK